MLDAPQNLKNREVEAHNRTHPNIPQRPDIRRYKSTTRGTGRLPPGDPYLLWQLFES